MSFTNDRVCGQLDLCWLKWIPTVTRFNAGKQYEDKETSQTTPSLIIWPECSSYFCVVLTPSFKLCLMLSLALFWQKLERYSVVGCFRLYLNVRVWKWGSWWCIRLCIFIITLWSEASICQQQLQGRNDSELLFVASCFGFKNSCNLWPYLMLWECKWVVFATWLFFSPGVVAVSDPRGAAADPPGPGLGATGGGALCGAGGLLTQQVDWLQLSTDYTDTLSLLSLQLSGFYCTFFLVLYICPSFVSFSLCLFPVYS